MTASDGQPPIGDRAEPVEQAAPELIAKGYQRYERHRFTLPRAANPDQRRHDLLRGGRAVAVLTVDPARDAIVLIRQFRIAAHLATGKGELVEIVAGRVDQGESDEAAARRECLEEIGVAPTHLAKLFGVLSTPGITDEYVTFYLAAIDSRAVQAHGGADEHEEIATQVVAIDDMVRALDAGTIANGLAVIGLQWLALNRGRLQSFCAAGPA